MLFILALTAFGGSDEEKKEIDSTSKRGQTELGKQCVQRLKAKKSLTENESSCSEGEIMCDMTKQKEQVTISACFPSVCANYKFFTRNSPPRADTQVTVVCGESQDLENIVSI